MILTTEESVAYRFVRVIKTKEEKRLYSHYRNGFRQASLILPATR